MSYDFGTNFRTGEGYPNHGKSVGKWAWEFLRRNAEYQETWRQAERIADEIRAEVSLKEFLRIGAAANYQRYHYESVIGMLSWACMRDDKRAMVEIGRTESSRTTSSYHCAHAAPWGLQRLVHPQDMPTVWAWPLPIVTQLLAPPREINPRTPILKFDLAVPVGAQLQYAKEILERLQQKQNADSGRLRPENYVNYLRCLDAMSAEGLSQPDKGITRKIAALVAPGIPNEYSTGYLGNQQVKNWIAAAVELRDGGYLRLLRAVKPRHR